MCMDYENTQRHADTLEANVRPRTGVSGPGPRSWSAAWTKRVDGASRRLVGQAGLITKAFLALSPPLCFLGDTLGAPVAVMQDPKPQATL